MHTNNCWQHEPRRRDSQSSSPARLCLTHCSWWELTSETLCLPRPPSSATCWKRRHVLHCWLCTCVISCCVLATSTKRMRVSSQKGNNWVKDETIKSKRRILLLFLTVDYSTGGSQSVVTVRNNNTESCRHVSLTMQSVLRAPSAMRPSGSNSNGASGQPPKKNLWSKL